MRILIIEYLTAGGLYREHIPPALAQEAALMRDAMLESMRAIAEVEILHVHDARLPLPLGVSDCHILQVGEDPWPIWVSMMLQADLVWLVAPESAGILWRLTGLVESSGKGLLSSTQTAVEIAGSKWLTYQKLKSAGVPVVETMRTPASLLAAKGWVVKPDDGVSCDDTWYFPDANSLEQWLEHAATDYIIQPYIDGIAASLTMLCRDGQAWLLTCNQQLIEINQGRVQYCGGIVNGLTAYWQECGELAQQVAAAMPGLFGYVGVDFMIDSNATDRNTRLQVLEVNPRLTTSFAGLQSAIGSNPARLLLDLFYNEHFKLPVELQRNRIEINLND